MIVGAIELLALKRRREKIFLPTVDPIRQGPKIRRGPQVPARRQADPGSQACLGITLIFQRHRVQTEGPQDEHTMSKPFS